MGELRLLPCPFCGTDCVATAPCFVEFEKTPGWSAICKACGVSVDGDTEAEAIAAWNTRKAPSAGQADVDVALREAILSIVSRHLQQGWAYAESVTDEILAALPSLSAAIDEEREECAKIADRRAQWNDEMAAGTKRVKEHISYMAGKHESEIIAAAIRNRETRRG